MLFWKIKICCFVLRSTTDWFHSSYSNLPVPLFQRDEFCGTGVCVCTHMRLWWSTYMYAGHFPCPIAACGLLRRGEDHDTAVNLKGKLIKCSTSDSLTSSLQNRLCSLTLRKNSHMLQRGGTERRRHAHTHSSQLHLPTLLSSHHFPDYDCMSAEGRSDLKKKKKEKREKKF